MHLVLNSAHFREFPKVGLHQGFQLNLSKFSSVEVLFLLWVLSFSDWNVWLGESFCGWLFPCPLTLLPPSKHPSQQKHGKQLLFTWTDNIPTVADCSLINNCEVMIQFSFPELSMYLWAKVHEKFIYEWRGCIFPSWICLSHKWP